MRAFLRLTSFTGLLVLAAGCGGPQTGDDAPKVVGASLLTKTHVFYQEMVGAMKLAAEQRDIELRIQYAEFNSQRQLEQIETFMAQGVDALLIAPTDSSGVTPVVADASARGIPVFTVDIAAKGADVVSHIASDNERGGMLIAEYLAEKLGGEGKVAIVDHPTVSSVQDRTRGFEKGLEAYPKIEIVQRVPGEGQRDKALRATQDLLSAQPNLDAIFAINDDSALGALAALEAAGRENDIIVAGFDGTPEARVAIGAGKALIVDCVQFPGKVGTTTIETIAAYFDGEDVPDEVPVEVALIDQDSLTRDAQ